LREKGQYLESIEEQALAMQEIFESLIEESEVLSPRRAAEKSKKEKKSKRLDESFGGDNSKPFE
jgi:hypothetical protein